MAFTPDQQYIADTVSLNKSVGDNEQCCLSLGGVVDFINESCDLPQYDTSINLSEMCDVAQNLAENEESVGGQGGGVAGFGEWFSTNLDGLTDSFVNVWGALNPLTTPTLPPTSGGSLDIPNNENDEEKAKKQIWLIVGFVLLLVVAVYFIRRR